MDATINVPRIVEAMREKGWGMQATCANCGVNNKSLAAVLSGRIPKRIDVLYRLCEGLGITAQEALNGGTPQKARLYLLPDRRDGQKIA